MLQSTFLARQAAQAVSERKRETRHAMLGHAALVAAFILLSGSFGSALTEATRVGLHGRGDYSFATVTLCLAFALGVYGWALSESARLLRANRQGRNPRKPR